MRQDRAEAVAAAALEWLAATDDLLGVFMGASGLTAADLRTRAAEADVLGAVLDFLTMDDAWVVAFCDARGLPYDAPLRARVALPGGAQVHWT
ncbi:DUF3572 family protein [Rhodobacteraceae bacterium CCMM004]|nr:DUF3572 family protein [Rhodobacteraceae bacterium CCMM004]